MVKSAGLIESLKKSDTAIYIYGAGDVAKEVYFCLSGDLYNIKIDAFLVSKITDETPKEINKIPVLAPDDNKIDQNAKVIVAVLEKYKDEICCTLDSLGMWNRVMLTFESDLWSEVRCEYFKWYCEKRGYQYFFDSNLVLADIINDSNEITDFKVYVTRSKKDKSLKVIYKKKEWEEEILAGAVLNTDEVSYVRDDTGENISHMNLQYCELTAMYWIWKNTNEKYIGLSHYRRRFDFDDHVIRSIVSSDFDVVVTTPVINVPNVLFMYQKNHNIEDWNIMKEVVQRLSSEYLEALEVVERSNYYIPYNMFLMKRNVFDKYCSWIFPILEECERIIGKKQDVYQNRYIGFLAERLMTVFFYQNRDIYKILFCNKHFLE